MTFDSVEQLDRALEEDQDYLLFVAPAHQKALIEKYEMSARVMGDGSFMLVNENSSIIAKIEPYLSKSFLSKDHIVAVKR